MSIYKGKTVTVARTAADIYSRVSDLSQYQAMVENLPEEARQRIQGVEFGTDSVKFNAPGIGELKFVLAECTAPSHVGFTAEGSPVPLKLALDLAAAGDTSTTITPSVDINIPAMLRPMIGGKIQQAADKFGEIFTQLFQG